MFQVESSLEAKQRYHCQYYENVCMFQVESSLEAKQRYHSQYYENGSLCDLTGKQREAEIHVNKII